MTFPTQPLTPDESRVEAVKSAYCPKCGACCSEICLVPGLGIELRDRADHAERFAPRWES